MANGKNASGTADISSSTPDISSGTTDISSGTASVASGTPDVSDANRAGGAIAQRGRDKNKSPEELLEEQ